MRKFLSTFLVVALVGSVSAQSLDDLRKKAYDSAIEAVNKGKNRKSAYEEYLEKQELEAAKKAEEEALEAKEAEEDEEDEEDEYWQAIDILHRCVFCDPINKNIFVKCYCYPIKDFVWYHAFIGTDGEIWVNIFYDDNGEVGEILFASAMQKGESTSTIVIGIKTPTLKVTFTSGDLLFIQDIFDPYQFSITW